MKERKERGLCKHYQHGLGIDVLCSASPNGCRDTQHPTWRIKIGGDFQWESGGWEAEACTPSGEVMLYSMSRLICMIFVADVIACRLVFFMSAMTNSS